MMSKNPSRMTPDPRMRRAFYHQPKIARVNLDANIGDEATCRTCKTLLKVLYLTAQDRLISDFYELSEGRRDPVCIYCRRVGVQRSIAKRFERNEEHCE